MLLRPGRGLCDRFFTDLQDGLLAPLRDRVLRDRTLCLELRENYFNIYYRGGNLMKVSLTGDEYEAFFDTRYFNGVEQPSTAQPLLLRTHQDVAVWLAALPTLKEAMDTFLGRNSKEREIQQLLLSDNNIGDAARCTDYFICDIEYANQHGRFDLVAVHWPSTPAERKKQNGRRLVFAEVKCGDGALEGDSGLHRHVVDLNDHLADPSYVARLKDEMVKVFNQKRALGLMNCEKDLVGFSDEIPLLILVIVNHDPEKSRLRGLLRSLPSSPHAELRVATGCLLGYGLFDPAILTVEHSLARFESCI
jgi:hypothetical protein